MAIAPDYAVLLPVFILTGVGALLPLAGAFRWRGGVLAGFSALGLVVAGIFTLAMVYELPTLGWMPQVDAEGGTVISFALLEMTPFVVLFNLVFILVALMTVLGSPRYIKGRHQGEYYGLVLLATVGMMLVAASRELITLFVALELASFCTYVLTGFFKDRVSSSEAAMKYFLVGSISSSLALFGISIVYGLTGDTTFAALNELWATPLQLDDRTVTLGDQMIGGQFMLGVFVWGLLLAGFGYKIAFVPFHNYVPDVYEGAPDTVGAFLSTGSKALGFAALFKVFLLGLFAVKANWDVMVGIIAIITMVVGNVAALRQTNIKRMLAYSSIGQAGYILIALAVGTDYALAGGLFHILTYSFMKAGAFVALAAAATWGIGEELADWKGMGRRSPYVAFCMAVFMLSFAGIPPLAGFASKFVLFSSAIAAGGWFVWLAVAGILTSAVSLVYYWRIIRVMYVEDAEGRPLAVASGAGMAITIGVVGTIVLGILWGPAYALSAQAADVLLAAVTTAVP